MCEADGGPPKCSCTLLRPDFAIEGDYQMDQTSSVPQAASLVSWALKRDSKNFAQIVLAVA
jgi:hypothetical protein